MIFDISIYEIWGTLVTLQRQEPGKTHTNDMGCAGPGSEHGKDPCATSDVQYRLVFEEVWIVYDCSAIRTRADRVL